MSQEKINRNSEDSDRPSIQKKKLFQIVDEHTWETGRKSLTSDQNQEEISSHPNKMSLMENQEEDQSKYSHAEQKPSVADRDQRKPSEANEALTQNLMLKHRASKQEGEKFSKGVDEFTQEKNKYSKVTIEPVEEIISDKKVAYELGKEDRGDDNKQHSSTEEKRFSKINDQSTRPSKIMNDEDSQKLVGTRSESQKRERKCSIPVGTAGEIRFSKVVTDRKLSKGVEIKPVSSEYELRSSIEVLEALPVPDKKMSKAATERYSNIIEQLEAEKEKAIIEKALEQRTSISGKKLRFGEDETPRNDTDIVSVGKGMRFEYRACPKTCEQFLRVDEFARVFVDDLIQEALVKGKLIRTESFTKVVEGIEYKEDADSLSVTSIGTYVCVFEWPTIEEFTPTLGATKITEYFSYWKFDEDWKYCVNFLKRESDTACDFYRYEAIFSIPCRQYPIPQATASVYFTFGVSRVRPKHCLVDAYYSFEGHRLVHFPGQFKLQEAWLFHIIDAKINFYKTLTF